MIAWQSASNRRTLSVMLSSTMKSDRAPRSRASRMSAKTRSKDRKSTRLNSSHSQISYAVFCLKKKKESLLAATAAVGAAQVDRFTHGTTVETTAILERQGARTAFVATAGCQHLLHLLRHEHV